MSRLMPHVEQHDLYTYLIESRSERGERRFVNIAANWAHGQCDCMDWATRRAKAIRSGKGPFDEKATCWHVRQAQKFWALQTILLTAPDEALGEGAVAEPPEERCIPADAADRDRPF